MTLAGDKLLFAISALEPLTWRSFSRAFDAIVGPEGPSLNEGDAQAIRRRSYAFLDALGHCEVTIHRGESRIAASPATLARMPLSGLPRAVLLGSRQGSTLVEIEAICTKMDTAQLLVEEASGNRAVVPTRIEIECEDSATLDALGTQLRIPYQQVPPAWVICSQSATITDVKAQLEWEEGRKLDWKRAVFDPGQLRMSSSMECPELGTSLVSYEDPYTRRQLFFLSKDGQASTIDKSWGRYAVLQSSGRQVLAYDERRQILVVPVTTPLPRLLGRAACLCSGRPPLFMDAKSIHHALGGIGSDLYLSVGAQIARTIAAAVGQVLQNSALDRITLNGAL